MKYGIISYPESINMGDEVQSVAASRLLPRVDYNIDRDRINIPVTEEKVKLICNGWFTNKPESWPPADNLIPLFISFHLTHSNKSYKLLADKKLKSYYSQFGPIGCRDLGTLNLLRKNGIEAYYSGDLTLTLENKFTERNNDILLVDPLRHNYRPGYREYIVSRLVPKKYQDQVRIIKQRRKKLDASVEERFKDAENLIEQYSKAKLVITSRIHCALPCLALGTPVYFIKAGYHSALYNLNDRFEGVLDMFRVIHEDAFPYAGKSPVDLGFRLLNLYKGSTVKPLPIDWENPEPNSFNFSELKNKLLNEVNKFIQ